MAQEAHESKRGPEEPSLELETTSSSAPTSPDSIDGAQFSKTAENERLLPNGTSDPDRTSSSTSSSPLTMRKRRYSSPDDGEDETKNLLSPGSRDSPTATVTLAEVETPSLPSSAGSSRYATPARTLDILEPVVRLKAKDRGMTVRIFNFVCLVVRLLRYSQTCFFCPGIQPCRQRLTCDSCAAALYFLAKVNTALLCCRFAAIEMRRNESQL